MESIFCHWAYKLAGREVSLILLLSSCSLIFCHQSAIVVDVTALICTASDAVDRNINAVTAAKMSLAVH